MRALVLGMALAMACTPVEAVPLSNAPVNGCPCDGFPGAECDANTKRCNIRTQGGRPPYPFFVVVQTPDTSFFAPATTFVLYSDEHGAPTFTRSPTLVNGSFLTKCFGATCAELNGLAFVQSEYHVARSQSVRVGYPLGDGQLVPARVEYVPIASSVETPAFVSGLPLGPRFGAPILTKTGAVTTASVPGGRYRRVMYPLPPFDALFPPIGSRDSAGADAFIVDTGALSDPFRLGDDTLDPPATRSVTVRRDEGLDGWQLWVQDSATKQRISTLKTLSGTGATLTMDTTGERRAANRGLGDTVEVVLAPPASYIAQPQFINPVNGGDLGTIRYPFVFSPVKVAGTVAEPGTDDTQVLGYAAHLSFESITITTPRETNVNSPLLHYATSLSTDERGGFATVLPPGTYNVTVEPLIGTSFAKARQVVVVDKDVNRLTLRPPKRTLVTGRVVLADGRPVLEADILATPRTPAASSDTPKPRPNRTQTGTDGRFALDLDQGPYVINAIPKAGTGFPPVSLLTGIIPDAMDLQDIAVPAPTILTFTVRDPIPGRENPVPNAFVRIFAVEGVQTTADFQTSRGEAFEIGNGTTDAGGVVEILLALGAQ